MIRSFSAGVVIVALAFLDTNALFGQNADSTAARTGARLQSTVFSIGQPPIWRQQLAAQATAFNQAGRFGATFSYGVFHSFNKPPITAFNPLIGLIGGTLEAYGSIGGAG